jgi:hypothetical protein
MVLSVYYLKYQSNEPNAPSNYRLKHHHPYCRVIQWFFVGSGDKVYIVVPNTSIKLELLLPVASLVVMMKALYG